MTRKEPPSWYPDEPALAGAEHLDARFVTPSPGSSSSWVLEPLIERCGFSIREAHYSESGTFADYLCEQSIVESL